ncbi:hypothetical protein ACLEQD_35140, partial [Corallococcus sp. 4LFB]
WPAAPAQGAVSPGTSGQVPARPERRPVARIAVAALLLVGASVGITTLVLRSHTAEQPVVPQALPPSEPVVASAPLTVEPPPAVTPPVEPPPPEAAVDAGVVASAEELEVKPEPVKPPPEVKPVAGTKRPVQRPVELVPAHLPVARIGETGGGQRVVNADVPKGINAGTVFKVVGPRRRGPASVRCWGRRPWSPSTRTASA